MPCPNIKSKEWLALESKYGLKYAVYLYKLNGDDIPSLSEAKQLLKDNANNDPYVNEALMSDTKELSDFTINHLSKAYPDIQLFNDREKFKQFVDKHNGNIDKVGIDTIGNAFMNAIYIDQKRAVQSTYFHEVAHIYWDALSDSNPVKNALISLFKEEYKLDTEIEEAIIRNIGKAGVSLSETELHGSRLNKFEKLLKEFWTKVKALLGIASKTNLINQLSRDIWNNKDNFNKKDFTTNLVKNMKNNPLNLSYDVQDELLKYGDIEMVTPRRLLNKLSSLSEEQEINEIINSRLRRKEKNDDDTKLSVPKKDNWIRMIKNKKKFNSEVGNSVKIIAKEIINGSTEKQIKELFITGKEGVKIYDRIDDKTLSKIYTVVSDIINQSENDGWEITSGALVGDLNSKIAGEIDLVMEKDGKLAVVNFTSEFEDDEPEIYAGKHFKAPINTIVESQQNRNRLESNVFANILEKQENKDVTQVIIIPFQFDTGNFRINKIDIGKYDFIARKKRNSKIKDSNRNNAENLIKHTSNIQKVRDESKLSIKDIERIAKQQNIDIDFLKESNEAITILSNFTGDALNEMTYENVEMLLDVGIQHLVNTLINTHNRTYNEIYGENGEEQIHAKELLLTALLGREAGYANEEILNISDFEEKVLNKGKSLSDFNARNKEEAFKNYNYEMRILNEIFDELNNIQGIKKLLDKNIDKYYKKVINFSSTEGFAFKRFLEGIKVSQLLTERIRQENSANYNGVKQGTIFLARLLKYDKPDIYKDFKDRSFIDKIFGKTWFKNMKLIDKDQILVQILGLEMASMHRFTVNRTEALRDTLEDLYNDRRYKDNEDKAGKKKPKLERKSLNNSDFEDITYTDKANGLKYFLTASKARTKMEEKYGIDDVRGRNMAAYVYTITEEMMAMDDRFRRIAQYKKGSPNILVPEVESTVFETYGDLSFHNKMNISNIRRIFGRTEVDNERVSYKGEEKRIIDLKHDFYDQFMQLNEEDINGKPVLEEMANLIKIAENRFKEIDRPKNKLINIVGKQSGRVVLKTKEYNSSIQEHMASMIEVKAMERIIPLVEFTKEEYKDVKYVTNFIENESDKKIYKDFDDFAKNSYGRMAKNFMNGLTMYVAATYLGFSVKTNIRNRRYGFIWNWISHPKVMTNSYKRTWNELIRKEGLNPLQAYKKLSGIMNYHNLGTVLQDVSYSKYDRFGQRLNKSSFFLLEATELWNQGELLKGLMENKEWLAYDKYGQPYRMYKGEKIDPSADLTKMTRKERIQYRQKIAASTIHPNALNNNRVNEFSNILSEVHGYFGFNKSQWSYHTMGRTIGMFTLSWVQSVFNFWYLPEQTDSVGRKRKGMINSLNFFINAGIFNVLKSSSGKSKALDKLERRYISDSQHYKRRIEAENALYEMDRYADPKDYISEAEMEVDINGKKEKQTVYFIPSSNVSFTDFEKFLTERSAEGKKGKIKFKESSDVDIKRFVRFMMLAGIRIGQMIIKGVLDDWEDEILHGNEYDIGGEKSRSDISNFRNLSNTDKFKYYLIQYLASDQGRVNEDMNIFINPDFYLGFVKNPIMVEAPINAFRAVQSVFNSNDKRYQDVSLDYAFNERKFISQVTKGLPYISRPLMDSRRLVRIATNAPYFEEIDMSATKASNAYLKRIYSDIMSGLYAKQKKDGINYRGLTNESMNEFELQKENILKYKELIVEAYKMQALGKDFKGKTISENEIIQDFLNFSSVSENWYDEEVSQDMTNELLKISKDTDVNIKFN